MIKVPDSRALASRLTISTLGPLREMTTIAERSGKHRSEEARWHLAGTPVRRLIEKVRQRNAVTTAQASQMDMIDTLRHGRHDFELEASRSAEKLHSAAENARLR